MKVRHIVGVRAREPHAAPIVYADGPGWPIIVDPEISTPPELGRGPWMWGVDDPRTTRLAWIVLALTTCEDVACCLATSYAKDVIRRLPNGGFVITRASVERWVCEWISRVDSRVYLRSEEGGSYVLPY